MIMKIKLNELRYIVISAHSDGRLDGGMSSGYDDSIIYANKIIKKLRERNEEEGEIKMKKIERKK